MLKQNRTDQNTRSTIFQLKREFRKMTIRKKREHKESILNQMMLKRNENNQKEFWKLLDKISPKNTSDSLNVSPHSFLEHFKATLFTDIPGEVPPESQEEGTLDYEINIEELKSASSILKPGKAIGVDELHNEMISSLVETHPEVILKLFNNILNS